MVQSKYTYEFVKEYFSSNGCKLLETEYKNTKIKLNYICKCDNKSSIKFSDFLSGSRCKDCRNQKMRLSYEYVYNFFKENECQLLSTEYKNNNTKLNFICKNGHKTSNTFNAFKDGRRCSDCSGNKKLTFEYINQFFKDNEYELLETEYKNHMSKMNFRCDKNHNSSISFNNFRKGIRCGMCKNKTECIILEYLEKINYKIVSQAKFDWCKIKNKLPFDFLLTDFKIIIECDGMQHFKNILNWQSSKLNLANDIYKTNLSINNGYKIIRISQEDVFNNKFNWQTLLKENIEKLINSEDNIIYLSTDINLYNKHKFELTKKILENKLLNLNLNK